jgi:hypothetical protein
MAMGIHPMKHARGIPDELQSDVLAVAASLRDMETGETGRPFDEFSDEFCRRNGIPHPGERD